MDEREEKKTYIFVPIDRANRENTSAAGADMIFLLIYFQMST